MHLICIMPVRNEDWVLGFSARAVLMWCDQLIVLNHASTDGTATILEVLANEYGNRITVLEDKQSVWTEMAHRQSLLIEARKQGATHIALVDADEVLTCNLLPTIRSHVAETPRNVILQLPWQCLRGNLYRAHSTDVWGTAIVSMAFQDSPVWHWSAGEQGGYDYHHRHPMGRPLTVAYPVSRDSGGLFHLQFVNDRRLRAKQPLYKMQEVTRWPGRSTVQAINTTYDRAVYAPPLVAPAIPIVLEQTQQERLHTRDAQYQLQPSNYSEVPDSWWACYNSLLSELHVDAEPWQEKECRRLWKTYGSGAFQGLNLYGVVS